MRTLIKALVIAAGLAGSAVAAQAAPVSSAGSLGLSEAPIVQVHSRMERRMMHRRHMMRDRRMHRRMMHERRMDRRMHRRMMHRRMHRM